jgi:hypothetical protein
MPENIRGKRIEENYLKTLAEKERERAQNQKRNSGSEDSNNDDGEDSYRGIDSGRRDSDNTSDEGMSIGEVDSD